MLKNINVLYCIAALLFSANSKSDVMYHDGRVWQDNEDAIYLKMTFDEAVAYCGSLRLAGHEDWELPTIKILQSIMSFSRSNPSIIDGFKFVRSDKYWSSTPFSMNADGSWSVQFIAGRAMYDLKSNKYYVRCVRSVE